MDNSTLTINIFAAIGGVIAAFLAGGGVSLAAAAVIIKRLKADVTTQNAVESLATSLPAGTLSEIREIIRLVQEGAELADVVTDGKPNLPSTINLGTPPSVLTSVGEPTT